MTMEECITQFLSEMETIRNLSPRTLKAYKYDLEGLRHFVGTALLQDIGTINIQGYIASLNANRIASASVKRKVATFKVFFRFLEREGVIEHTPMWRFAVPYKTPKRLPRVIPHDDLVKILVTAHDRGRVEANNTELKRFLASRNVLTVELLFALGLRIDELVRLDDENVDTSAGTVLVFGKGRKERTLFLSSAEVRSCVDEYRALRHAIFHKTQALFVNRSGKRLTSGSIGRIFDALCRQAGLHRRYTPHCLRHTMATQLMENGADVRSVQEILGHNSIGTTEIYLHVSAKRKQDVFSRFHERNRLRLKGVPLP